ncbi:S8 family serine peptidase [Mesorhizobium sp. C120A]|uniref:S8 family serine peptidase n=1 Tax=unclassified Mesorhizobium TaxID=325217 RepID=UPI0003CFC15A|nr:MULTISPECIES: S8 family serine peptidase [unclassified Mesorhizobium]ESZ62459.1 hypothetical protein X728_11475 [Mesorhizobium sp. L103C120A0]WJI42193.1 S8 family serine peptidase [Mesorhizobium sp. C120A]
MRSKYVKGIALFLYSSAVVLCPGMAAADDNALWQLRGVANIAPTLQIELAKAGEPIWKTIETKGGASLRRVVTETCGDQPPAVSDFLLAESVRLNVASNPDTLVAEGSAVAVPFCLKVERNVEVTIAKGDTPEKIMKDNYGVFGRKTLDRFYDLNGPKFGANSFHEFAQKLPIGETVTVPWASQIRVFAERPESTRSLPDLLNAAQDATSVLPQIENTLAPAVETQNREAYQFSVVNSVEFESSTQSCSTGNGAASAVDLDLLAQRFAIQKAQSDAFNSSTAKSATVGIIDTGISEIGDSFFKLAFFSPNPRELVGTQDTDDDVPQNNFVDDIYGINFNSRSGDVRPYPDDSEIRSHGTKMSAIILGGPRIATEWTGKPTVPLIRLKVVNFESARDPGATVGAENLAGAIGYLADQGADVINMSLSSGQNIFPVSQMITAKQNVLFVVAAGNAKSGEGRNIDFSPLVFPARYGGRSGDHKRTVVTVGAHDLQGEKAAFSNYSSQFVDLLAPGCSVPTRDDQGNPVEDNGTSPAAASVSFVAALLNTLGFADPGSVKNRLLTSVDFNEKLKDTVWSSGRLNVIKAISVWDDVIQTTDMKYKFVKIKDRASLNRYCSESSLRPDIGRVRKIVPNISTAAGIKIEYWVENDNLISRLRCPQIDIPAGDSIGDIGGEAGPSLSDVQDITFSAFSPVH